MTKGIKDLTPEQCKEIGISPDGICVVEGCNNSLIVGNRQEYKQYCRPCKAERAEYFRMKYHEDQLCEKYNLSEQERQVLDEYGPYIDLDEMKAAIQDIVNNRE